MSKMRYVALNNEISGEISVKIVENFKSFDASSDNNTGYILMLSIKDNTILSTEHNNFVLSNHQAIIIKKNDIKGTEINTEDIIAVAISGKLTARYIDENQLNRVLSFHAGDDMIISVTALVKAEAAGLGIRQTAKIGFSILMDIFTYHEDETNNHPRIVTDAIGIIETEYPYLYGVDDLADKIGVTKSHLIRVFHQYMNITPGRYLENHRIEQAKLFLASGDMTIEAVAGLCGYANKNYFGKVFKKRVGITPKRYMKDQALKKKPDHKVPDDFYL